MPWVAVAGRTVVVVAAAAAVTVVVVAWTPVAVVLVVLVVVVVAGAAVVVVTSLVARQRGWLSVAVVEHVIGVPADVTPVAPTGEQNAPGVTVAWPLAPLVRPEKPTAAARTALASMIRRRILMPPFCRRALGSS